MLGSSTTYLEATMSSKRNKRQPARTGKELIYLHQVRGDETDAELEALAEEAFASVLRALEDEEQERPDRGPKGRRQRQR
jgi:hypothetical protein